MDGQTVAFIKGWRFVVMPPVATKERRSWRERIFSLTPWRKFKTAYYEVLPAGEVITIPSDLTVYMTRADWDKFKKIYDKSQGGDQCNSTHR